MKCAICLEPLKYNNHKFTCDHQFHIECLAHWLTKQRSCPLCRKFINKEMVKTLCDENKFYDIFIKQQDPETDTDHSTETDSSEIFHLEK